MSSTPIFNSAGVGETVNGNLLVTGNETVYGNAVVNGSLTAGSISAGTFTPSSITTGAIACTSLTDSGTISCTSMLAQSGITCLGSSVGSFPLACTVNIGSTQSPSAGQIQTTYGDAYFPLELNPSGGAVSTKYNTLDDGSGNTIIASTNGGANDAPLWIQYADLGVGGQVYLEMGQAKAQAQASAFGFNYLSSANPQLNAATMGTYGGPTLSMNHAGLLYTDYNTLDSGTGAATFAGLITASAGLTASGLITASDGLTATAGTTALGTTTCSTSDVGDTVILECTAPALAGDGYCSITVGVNSSVDNNLATFGFHYAGGSGSSTNDAYMACGTGALSVSAIGQVTSTSNTLDSGTGAATFAGLITASAGLTSTAGTTALGTTTVSGLLTASDGLTLSNATEITTSVATLTLPTSTGTLALVTPYMYATSAESNTESQALFYTVLASNGFAIVNNSVPIAPDQGGGPAQCNLPTAVSSGMYFVEGYFTYSASTAATITVTAGTGCTVTTLPTVAGTTGGVEFNAFVTQTNSTANFVVVMNNQSTVGESVSGWMRCTSV